MSEVHLAQREDEALLAMAKYRIDDSIHEYPGLGGGLRIPVASIDRREMFSLDIERGRINLLKGKYQHRARGVVVLARLDFGGAPHRNPDDQEIASPHIHLYREGYGDKWAYPIPQDLFTNIDDRFATLTDFMRFCNIIEPPNVIAGLFT